MSIFSRVKTFCLSLIFLSGLSCQNLHYIKKSFIDKQKNLQSKSPIIDQNYFETQADLAYLRGEKAFFKKDPSNALKHFKTALLFQPQSSHLRKRIAEIYEREGLLAEALGQYKILAHRKEPHKFHQKLIGIYNQRGLGNIALKKNQSFLEHGPDNFSLWMTQALLQMEEGNYKKALQSFKKAEDRASQVEEKIPAILSQTYLLIRLQNAAQGLKVMERIFHFPFMEEKMALEVANFYKSMGKLPLALSFLENFETIHGPKKQVSQRILDYYISSKKWDKLKQKMEQMQDFGHFESPHYFYMAMLLMDEKNYNKALAFLKDLVAKEPLQGQYLYWLAFVHEQKKQWWEAINIYNRVPHSSSHFLAAKLRFAILLRQIGQETKSLAMLQKLSFLPETGIYLQALLLYASSLWDKGYKRKAILALNKGLQRKPFQEDLLFLRGVYFQQLGYPRLALKDMNQILKKQANHKNALGFIASLYPQQKSQFEKNDKKLSSKKADLILN